MVAELQCVIHRRSASGIMLGSERIAAATEVEAIARAKARFSALLGSRSGSAALRDESGRILWTSRRPAAADASAAGG